MLTIDLLTEVLCEFEDSFKEGMKKFTNIILEKQPKIEKKLKLELVAEDILFILLKGIAFFAAYVVKNSGNEKISKEALFNLIETDLKYIPFREHEKEA